jgi:hypothetical protein
LAVFDRLPWLRSLHPILATERLERPQNKKDDNNGTRGGDGFRASTQILTLDDTKVNLAVVEDGRKVNVRSFRWGGEVKSKAGERGWWMEMGDGEK